MALLQGRLAEPWNVCLRGPGSSPRYLVSTASRHGTESRCASARADAEMSVMLSGPVAKLRKLNTVTASTIRITAVVE